MSEDLVIDYTAYLKLDVTSSFQTVQNVVDSMLTRLEELTSVLQMIKMKNNDCNLAVTEDIIIYRSEIATLSKKIIKLNEVISKLQSNADLLEKQVEKAETDFGLSSNNKIKCFLKPFLKRNKEVAPPNNIRVGGFDKITLQSIMDNFDNK